MSSYRRPWWLMVNKPAGLVTTIQEESWPGERVFIIRGEPMVQGLAWLTWGPAAALAVVLVLAGLAIVWELREQSWLVRGPFILAFLALPALTWGIVVSVLVRLSEKHLRAEREAGSQGCVIRLDQQRGQLVYQMAAQPEAKLDYDCIHHVHTAHTLGERGSQAMLRLVMETDQGKVILLGENLGTSAQKADLAREIQEAIDAYARQQSILKGATPQVQP